ncbi:MAG: hypothetical protein MUC43_12710 [Pirellula sp.]|nr:hypothetical protein [Pirellula sp.]
MALNSCESEDIKTDPTLIHVPSRIAELTSKLLDEYAKSIDLSYDPIVALPVCSNDAV